MTETPALEFVGVVKQYGALRPLRMAALEVSRGAIVAVTGLDAAAAETFVNLATGATLPDEGEVRVFGRSTAAVSDADEWLTWARSLRYRDRTSGPPRRSDNRPERGNDVFVGRRSDCRRVAHDGRRDCDSCRSVACADRSKDRNHRCARSRARSARPCRGARPRPVAARAPQFDARCRTRRRLCRGRAARRPGATAERYCPHGGCAVRLCHDAGRADACPGDWRTHRRRRHVDARAPLPRR